MRVRLSDVAKYSGVSTKTVSRVINREKNVTPEMREKVWKAVEELGYVAHAPASHLARGRSNIIGMILPYVLSSYASILLDSILQRSNEQGYSVLVQPNPAIEDRAIVELCLGGQIDGLIIGEAGYYNQNLLITLSSKKIPHVLFHPNAGVYGDSASLIQITDYAGVLDAVQHLIQFGHKRIGFIPYDFELTYSQERYRAYQDALRSANIPFDPLLVVKREGTFSGGFAATQQLLALSDRPTAIVAANDEMAFGAENCIWQMGLRIPGDISVIGFDDIPLATQTNPPLTTVRQPIQEEGKTAVDILIERIEKKGLSSVRVEFPTELILRESTGPAPLVRENRIAKLSS